MWFSSNFILPLLGSLKTQLTTNFATVDTFAGVQWFQNIYSFAKLDRSVTNLDCCYQCFKIQSLTCQFFVLLNDICYFGRADISNGTSTGILVNTPVTIYSLKGKRCCKWLYFWENYKACLPQATNQCFLTRLCLFTANSGQFFFVRAGTAGSKWSKYIYKQLNLTQIQCEILCALSRFVPIFLCLSMLGQVEKSFKKLVMQPKHDWRIPHDRILKVICLITGPIIGFGSKLRLVHKHAA